MLHSKRSDLDVFFHLEDLLLIFLHLVASESYYQRTFTQQQEKKEKIESEINGLNGGGE